MRIGNYSIPRFRLPTLIEATRRIYDSTQGSEVESEVVAHILELSPASGGFKQKLADLRTYGLLVGRGKIQVSELGKKITHPTTDDEKNEAHLRLVTNVPLWETIYNKYGINIPESNFWVDLSKITGAEAPEAKKEEISIRKAYKEDITNLKPIEKPRIGGEGPPRPPTIGQEAFDRRPRMEYPTASEFPRLIVPEYGATLEIKDVASLNAAIALFEAIKAKIQRGQPPQPSEKEGNGEGEQKEE